MTFRIDYENIILNSLRIAIRDILKQVAEKGLPGKHHFYITFDPRKSGVKISTWLTEKYPTSMTIVIQNWFEKLQVHDSSFSIILNFNNAPEEMTIPFKAIKSFSDPSILFSVNFGNQEIDQDTEARPVLPKESFHKHGAQKTDAKKIKNLSGLQKKPRDLGEKASNVISIKNFKKTE